MITLDTGGSVALKALKRIIEIEQNKSVGESWQPSGKGQPNDDVANIDLSEPAVTLKEFRLAQNISLYGQHLLLPMFPAIFAIMVQIKTDLFL